MIFLLVVSICLGSNAYGSVWPYHGSVGLVSPATDAIIPTGTVNVSLVEPTPPEINLKSTSVATLVAGPNSGATIVKGAVAGPVTVTAGLSAAAVGVLSAVGVSSGPSQGSVTTVGPSDGSINVSGAAGIAGAIITTVVGPSTGPVVVAGPNAVPAVVPVNVAMPEDVGIADVNENTGESVVIKGGTSSQSDVSQGLPSDPIVSQEILGNTVLVSEPRVKILTPASPVIVGSAVTRVEVSGPAGGNVAVSRPQAPSIVVSGSSGTIATTG